MVFWLPCGSRRPHLEPRPWPSSSPHLQQSLTFTCRGGEEVLLDVGGQDSTEAFEDVGHSDEAREILEGLLVGKLKRQVRLSHSPSRTPLFPTRSCILRSLPRITLRTLGFVAGDGDLASGIPRGVLDTISE